MFRDKAEGVTNKGKRKSKSFKISIAIDSRYDIINTTKEKGVIIMKDYKKYIDLDYTQDLLNTLADLGCETFTIAGVLNDTHLINTEDLQRKGYKLGRVKFRKYLILGHEFANANNDHLYMKLTDNNKLFKELYQEYAEELKEEKVNK